MKNWISVLLALTLLFSLTACVREEKAENPYRMKSGAVEYYQGGELSSREEFFYHYNDQGHLSQVLSYKDGILYETCTYETDAYGNNVGFTVETPDGKMRTTENKLTLDEAHRIIRCESYDGNILGSIREMAYDQNGNQTLLMINRVDAKNEGKDWISWVEDTYDSDSNLIRTDTRWDDGTGSYSIYEYQNGMLIRCESYNNYDRLTGWEEYTYDETGLVQTCQHFKADSTPGTKTISTFDEYSNLLRREIYAGRDPVTEETDDLVDRVVIQTFEPIVPET